VALPPWLTDPKTQPLAIAAGLVLVALLLRR